MFLLIVAFVTSSLTFTQGLELHLMKEDLSCANVNDGIFPTQEFINKTWIESVKLWHLAAGSKYHLTWITLHHLNHDMGKLKKVTEDQLQRKSCFTCTIDRNTMRGQIIGYGGDVSNYEIKDVSHGVLDFIPIPLPSQGEISRHSITLTDNKSFVFFTNCWLGSNQKTWDLITVDETIDPTTMQTIVNHAISSGFDKEQFVFLKYRRCKESTTEL